MPEDFAPLREEIAALITQHRSSTTISVRSFFREAVLKLTNTREGGGDAGGGEDAHQPGEG